MSGKNRLIAASLTLCLSAVFLAVSLLTGSFHSTWPMVIGFTAGTIAYQTIGFIFDRLRGRKPNGR